MWTALVVVAVTAHYLFLAYLVVGGFIAWRWPRTIVAHLLTAVWAVLIVTTGVQCPLTALQNTAREHLGQAPLRGGFIELYVRATFYPTGADALAQALVGMVVLASWIGLLVRLRRRHSAHAST